jgi:hypothetical protein
MALVQISRIQHRKGLMEDLPQLAGGELGWAVDQRRLFIGNGTLAEGAPVIGNTEILTNFSGLADIATLVYKGEPAGYIAQTGSTPASPIRRTLQAKFDDRVSVKDFGAVGDGVADDTLAIARALTQLYTVNSSDAAKKVLYFPAGEYLITAPIAIPPHTQIMGEGMHSTVFTYEPASSVNTSDPVFRTADFALSTGNSIGGTTAIIPTGWHMSGFAVQSIVENTIFLLEGLTDSVFDKVKVVGALVPELSVVDVIPLIDCQTVTASNTRNIRFYDCDISTGDRAIRIADTSQDIVVYNSVLDSFRKAVETTGTNTGIRVMSNTIKNVVDIALDFKAGASQCISGFNLFVDCSLTNSLPIVKFQDDNNVSVGDMFQRAPDPIHGKNIETSNSTAIAFDMSEKVQVGTYTRESGRRVLLAGNAPDNTTLFSLEADYYPAFEVEYALYRGSRYRVGCMRVIMNPGDTDPVFDDDYLQATDCGIDFTVTKVGSFLEFKYSLTANPEDSGILNYSIKRLL